MSASLPMYSLVNDDTEDVFMLVRRKVAMLLYVSQVGAQQNKNDKTKLNEDTACNAVTAINQQYLCKSSHNVIILLQMPVVENWSTYYNWHVCNIINAIGIHWNFYVAGILLQHFILVH